MSVLSDNEIRALVHENGLIAPFKEQALQGASYDLTLGELMVIGGVPKTVSRQEGGHDLEPGSFALVTTHEYLHLPLNVVAHYGIVAVWSRRGIVPVVGPQLDPGFEGVLEVPVFNAGDANIRLFPGDSFFTIEFVSMTEPASFGWADRWGPKNPPTYPLPPKASRPNLIAVAELRDALGDLTRELNGLRSQLGALDTKVSNAEGALKSQIGELRFNVNALDKIVEGTTLKKSLGAIRWNLLVAVLAMVLTALTVAVAILALKPK